MDVGKVTASLNSKFRREILKTLFKQPMTVVEVLEELNKRRIQVKYRETVYRALEKLSDAQLVEKYYEKSKGLCYKLSSTRWILEIGNDSVDLRKGC